MSSLEFSGGLRYSPPIGVASPLLLGERRCGLLASCGCGLPRHRAPAPRLVAQAQQAGDRVEALLAHVNDPVLGQANRPIGG